MKFTSLSDLDRLLPGKERNTHHTKAHKEFDGKREPVKVYLDKSNRNGKTVTIIDGLKHNPAVMKEIASALKQLCGAGGTVKGVVIEIQGDQKEKISQKLKDMDYTVR
jgi:translation initiation factor 1